MEVSRRKDGWTTTGESLSEVPREMCTAVYSRRNVNKACLVIIGELLIVEILRRLQIIRTVCSTWFVCRNAAPIDGIGVLFPSVLFFMKFDGRIDYHFIDMYINSGTLPHQRTKMQAPKIIYPHPPTCTEHPTHRPTDPPTTYSSTAVRTAVG